MSFVTALALGIVALAALPLLAHRLRRLRADERPFAAARLVPPALPRARRRAQLEDRALFGVRTAAIVALALLGASPLMRCSRLSLSRASGASLAVVLVVDDSMSMRASIGGRTRFARAAAAARELAVGARDGDAMGVVLAGRPSRVLLAPTTELGAVQDVVDALKPSDRATDLDGALHLADTLLAPLPQIDKRIVLLSDLADGAPEAPLGEGVRTPIWTPLAEITGDDKDCAVIAADDVGGRVIVKVACSPGATAADRKVEVRLGDRVLGSATATATGEVIIELSKDAPDGERVARLLGGDAIATNDAAPVLIASTGAIGVVAEASDDASGTGGPPAVEQALAALRPEFAIHPLPALPDHIVDYTSLAAIVVDDPPGFTPEQRRAATTFLEGGGVMLLALGPRAAAAPLGATLEPIITRSPSWSDTKVLGIAADSPTNFLGEATRSLVDLGAKKRTTLGSDDAATLSVMVAWSDGALLVGHRMMGAGEVYVVTLPLSLDASDFPLRPAFLAFLDTFVGTTRMHAAPRRAEVGSVWTLANDAKVVGPDGPLTVAHEGGKSKLVPGSVGAYHVTEGNRSELRVAAPVPKELDFRPRAATSHAGGDTLGATQAQVDISGHIALALLALLCAELVLRWRARRGMPQAA